MRDSPDPTIHRTRQQQFVSHTQRLIAEVGIAVDTTAGRRPVTDFFRDVTPSDDTYGVKQKMIELGLHDRELQRNMPPGMTLDVTLSQKTLFGGKQPTGRMRVVAMSPTAALLKGEPAPPLSKADVSRALSALPPPLGNVPQTVVLVSTSGFGDDALALAERRPGGPLILATINDGGGWTITAPPGYEDLAAALDPETLSQKQQRVRQDVESSGDLLTSGASADRVAQRLHLPLPLVEQVLKSYVQEQEGLAVGTFEGKLVLYRQGLASLGPTGENMPFWEKVRGIFGKGEESRDKKVSRLSQEKALLAQQRDKAYAEIEQVEKKESELTKSFPSATPLAQKRIATEISQLRKRVERIQQLVSTIDKKINIVETGVHNLEMEQHLSKERLESLENVAQVSEQVDVGLATLDQLNEVADSVSVVGSEMSMGAQDVLAELQAKFAESETAETTPAARQATGPEKAPPTREKVADGPPPIPGERRRMPGAAEPG